jgi:uncharacterized membrane protein
MQIDPGAVSAAWLWLARLLALAIALWAAWCVPWRRLIGAPGEVHRFAACAVALMVLWTLRAQVSDGPGLHILGVTTVTLLLGPALALMATLIAQIVTGLTAEPGTAPAASWLVGSVLPVLVTEAVRRGVWRWLPPDPFVFIFGCAFLGAAISACAAHLGIALLLGAPATLWPGAVPSWPGFVLLIAFPEAFINGCVVTLLVVYWPEHLRGYAAGYEPRRRL